VDVVSAWLPFLDDRGLGGCPVNFLNPLIGRLLQVRRMLALLTNCRASFVSQNLYLLVCERNFSGSPVSTDSMT
jgi:hypothetical protein